MITWMHAYCELSGEKFSPSGFASDYALPTVKANEPGSIGTTGRHKGKPMPYGTAIIEMVEGFEFQIAILQALIDVNSKLYELGNPSQPIKRIGRVVR